MDPFSRFIVVFRTAYRCLQDAHSLGLLSLIQLRPCSEAPSQQHPKYSVIMVGVVVSMIGLI
jgi:hypothetical protein